MLPLEEIKGAFAARRPVILLDDIASEVNAYLVFPAELATQANIAILADQALGLVCAAIESSHADQLGLSRMGEARSIKSLDFTLSIEARHGVSTGISAADRAHTLKTLALTSRPELDLVMPGHIFPVRTKKGGVLVKNTPPEACLDLCLLTDHAPVAAFAILLDRKGEPLTKTDVINNYAANHQLKTVTISGIIRHRLLSEPIVEEVGRSLLPTLRAGDVTAIVIRSNNDGAEHLALLKGTLLDESGGMPPIPVRVHTEKRIEDLLYGMNNGGRKSIEQALDLLRNLERGIFLYIRHPRRGYLKRQAEDIALAQEPGSGNNLMSSIREYGIGAQILHLLGIRRVILITSSGKQLAGIENFGLEIVRTFTPDQTTEICNACQQTTRS
ncbi:MAG: 3,4-dihydroxy-2-butanone-4-phosphate synthase [bacterium]|nr:3,4-dihydroxy-2-butanone-4-phosphate synthase [bacterium]